ncbi:hypothetical protein FOA52_015522 [Chlamydomonas sp. UWO 241]|nr:hypothetical protein FOA52_015522 [Chlamydomonas sp. UWO 241]
MVARLACLSAAAATAPSAWHYVGCFSDKSIPRALPFLLASGDDKLSVEKCAALAAARPYAMFGLQDGSNCWAGHDPVQAQIYGKRPDYDCWKPCPSEPGQICGGYMTNSVYYTFGREATSLLATEVLTASWLVAASLPGRAEVSDLEELWGMFPTAAWGVSCVVDSSGSVYFLFNGTSGIAALRDQMSTQIAGLQRYAFIPELAARVQGNLTRLNRLSTALGEMTQTEFAGRIGSLRLTSTYLEDLSQGISTDPVPYVLQAASSLFEVMPLAALRSSSPVLAFVFRLDATSNVFAEENCNRLGCATRWVTADASTLLVPTDAVTGHCVHARSDPAGADGGSRRRLLEVGLPRAVAASCRMLLPGGGCGAHRLQTHSKDPRRAVATDEPLQARRLLLGIGMSKPEPETSMFQKPSDFSTTSPSGGPPQVQKMSAADFATKVSSRTPGSLENVLKNVFVKVEFGKGFSAGLQKVKVEPSGNADFPNLNVMQMGRVGATDTGATFNVYSMPVAKMSETKEGRSTTGYTFLNGKLEVDEKFVTTIPAGDPRSGSFRASVETTGNPVTTDDGTIIKDNDGASQTYSKLSISSGSVSVGSVDVPNDTLLDDGVMQGALNSPSGQAAIVPSFDPSTGAPEFFSDQCKRRARRGLHACAGMQMQALEGSVSPGQQDIAFSADTGEAYSTRDDVSGRVFIDATSGWVQPVEDNSQSGNSFSTVDDGPDDGSDKSRVRTRKRCRTVRDSQGRSRRVCVTFRTKS